jgi:hypothetical protein
VKVIYIAGKYRAKTEWELIENIRHAELAARRLWAEGWSVICPHKNTAHFGGLFTDEQIDYETWINGDLELIRRSDAIYMLNNWGTSNGAKRELELAKELGKEIYYE